MSYQRWSRALHMHRDVPAVPDVDAGESGHVSHLFHDRLHSIL